MANKYMVNSSTYPVCAYDPREAYKRQTTLGTAWNVVRLGIFYNFVPASSDDAACTAESVAVSTPVDWLTFGLKDSSDVLPGKTGAKFMGLVLGPRTPVALTSNASGAASVTDVDGGHHDQCAGWVDTTNEAIDVGAGAVSAVSMPFPIFSTSDAYGFFALQFAVQLAGTSGQLVEIKAAFSGTAVTDVSKANLRAMVAAASYIANTNNRSIYWNTGSAARPLLDYFYIRSPFLNNRLRLKTYGDYFVS